MQNGMQWWQVVALPAEEFSADMLYEGCDAALAGRVYGAELARRTNLGVPHTRRHRANQSRSIRAALMAKQKALPAAGR